MNGSPILSDFEGDEVVRAGLEIRNAAGGLNKALKVDAIEFHRGDKAYVVLELDLAKIRHDPEDEDTWCRVHIFDAVAATFIDETAVRSALDEQARKIRVADDQARGQGALTGQSSDSEVNPDALPPTPATPGFSAEDAEADHLTGRHASKLVAGCPLCAEEIDALADEHDAGEHDGIPPRDGCPRCAANLAAHDAADQVEAAETEVGPSNVTDLLAAGKARPAKARTRKKAAGARKAAKPGQGGGERA